MRKLITVLLALIIALTPVLALAESMNLAALLADKSNKNVGNEDGVYNAFYKILVKANGKDFPLKDIMLASTCISKIATGEAFSPAEILYDESLSAYEKYFLFMLTNSTLTDEEAEALTAVFDGSVKAFPSDGKALYVSDKEKTVAGEAGDQAEQKDDKDAFITGLIRQAMEQMGYQFIPEAVDESLTLYTIKDKDDVVKLSAREVLTSLPHAMLMKHVPEEKKEESAAALARLEASIPDVIDWTKVVKGDDADYDSLDSIDAFFEDTEAEEGAEGAGDEAAGENPEEKVELTEKQKAEWTQKWLSLFFACDAYDQDPSAETFTAASEALLGMVEDKPEVTFEAESGNGISLRYAEAAPEATPAPAAADAAASGATATKAPAKELVELDAQYQAYTGNYIVYVSKNSCTIAIIGRDSDKRWTKKVKAFPTSIGKAGQTRSGLFWLSKKERWHSWTDSYSPYSVKQSGGSYMHGPMYTAKDSNKMIASSYNAIGTKSSAGCLGTCCAAAGWIYYNCPIGTMVIIADDSKFKASKLKKIPDDQTYDPTESGVKPTAMDPNASIAAPTATPEVTATAAATANPDATATPAPAVTQAPAVTAAPTTAPAPQDQVQNTIKEVQSLLIFAYPELELGDEVNDTSTMGDRTKGALKTFQEEYVQQHPELAAADRPNVEGYLDENTVKALRAATNPMILQLQSDLVALNLLTQDEKDAANGAFDEKTINAVRSFQRDNNLLNTGVADVSTQKALVQHLPVTPVPTDSTVQTPTDNTVQTPEDNTVETPQNNTVQVTFDSVTLENTALTVGDETTLTPAFTPADASVSFTYASDDEAVATVSEAEDVVTVKAVGVGTATITVIATADTGYTIEPETQTVTVTVDEAFSFDKTDEDAVRDIQSWLVAVGQLSDTDGVATKESAIDGDYGNNTSEAVEAFQDSKDSLSDSPDGEIDKATYDALKDAGSETIEDLQDDLISFGEKIKESKPDMNILKDADFKKEDNPEKEGRLGARTKAAIAAFQDYYNDQHDGEANAVKLKEYGYPDKATQKALRKEIDALENAAEKAKSEDNSNENSGSEQPGGSETGNGSGQGSESQENVENAQGGEGGSPSGQEATPPSSGKTGNDNDTPPATQQDADVKTPESGNDDAESKAQAPAEETNPGPEEAVKSEEPASQAAPESGAPAEVNASAETQNTEDAGTDKPASEAQAEASGEAAKAEASGEAAEENASSEAHEVSQAQADGAEGSESTGKAEESSNTAAEEGTASGGAVAAEANEANPAPQLEAQEAVAEPAPAE